MRDILSRNVAYGGAFSADGAKIMFDLGPGHGVMSAGMIGQQIRWQYGQSISRVYDLGGPQVYLVAGRTQGQVSLDTILGPNMLMTEWYKQFGNGCHLERNHISFEGQTGCGAPGVGTIAGRSLLIHMKHCVIEQLGGAVQAEQMLIQQQVQIMFLIMQMENAGGGTPGTGKLATPDWATGGPLAPGAGAEFVA